YVGGAAGALLAALPALLRDRLQVAELHAYDSTVLVYSALALVVAWLYSRLSSRVEGAPLPRLADLAHDAPPSIRREVRKFSWLSALDAVGGGFIGSAVNGFFFFLAL